MRRHSDPSMSADGAHIAFRSHDDLTGQNPDHNLEIFLFEDATDRLTQITNSTEINPLSQGNRTPAINAAGTYVVFGSNLDLIGKNADGNIELYMYNVSAHALTQITNTVGGRNERPSISADGATIAFASNRNLAGNNTDGNHELFVFDTTTNNFSRITNSSGVSTFGSSISADGKHIAFDSDGNLTDDNTDGNTEIFLYDAVTDSFTQATQSGVGFNIDPSINASGARVAFHSNRNLTGNNIDRNEEIFLFDTGAGTLTQMTASVRGGSQDAASNVSGTRIAFSSSADLNGNNVDRSTEIFVFDTNTSTFTQVTESVGRSNADPTIDSSGTRIAFSSEADLTGSNPDGSFEIFQANCGLPGGAVMCGGLEATIVGTAAAETINATPGADVIHALAGNDTIRGREGEDTICGGAGSDRVMGGNGNDRLFAGTSNDRLSGNRGRDDLDGGGNADRCDGGAPVTGDAAVNCETVTRTP